MNETPTLVVFAGPNGSGKSTLTRRLQQEEWFPTNYINPDEISASLPGNESNVMERSRQAQQIAEQQRQDYLVSKASFAFETVMSHPSKLAIMQQAQEAGFDVTLVFVSTNNPQINVDRVASRVEAGGHDVPTNRIINRYHRTLELLPQAIELADKTYLFDNSENYLLGATLDGSQTIQQVENAPAWIKQSLTALQERAEERSQLQTIAEKQIRSAELNSSQYAGIIREVTPHFVVQQVDDTLILHERSASILDRPTEVGQSVQITYREGVGSVELQQYLEQQNDSNDNERDSNSQRRNQVRKQKSIKQRQKRRNLSSDLEL